MKRTFLLAAVALMVGLLMGGDALAQPGRGGPGGFGGGGGALGLLRNQQVLDELDIVEEQQEKLEAIGEKLRDEMREMFSGMRDLSREEREEKFGELREKMQERVADIQKEVDEILLPNQRDRLKQIANQMQNRGGASRALNGSLGDELGLSDKQKEELTEKAQELRAELEKKIGELRKESEDELLQVLTPEQRKKYKKMLGEPFEFQQQGWGGRGGDRGRGQGGDRGRDGGRRDRPET